MRRIDLPCGLRLSRRHWLGRVASTAVGGVLAASVRVRGESEPVTKGRIFVFTRDLGGRAKGPFVLLSIDPETGLWAQLPHDLSDVAITQWRFSPGATRLAGQRFDDMGQMIGVWTMGTRESTELTRLTRRNGRVCWSADGRELIVSDGSAGSWRIKVDGSGVSRLPIPEKDTVVDWSADGQWLLTESERRPDGVLSKNADYQSPAVYAMRPDGSDSRLLLDGGDYTFNHRIAPDGHRVVHTLYLDPPGEYQIGAVDLDGRNRRRIFPEQKQADPFQAAWSPDGSRLALVLFDWERDDDGRKRYNGNQRLMTFDPDGRNPRQISLPPLNVLRLIDWR